jgi:stalled ribosome alternative rescue factor ArfA
MRKQNKANGLPDLPKANPVAKFAQRFNKAQVFKDKRHYKRKAKHPGQEPFSIFSSETIEKGFGPAVTAAHLGPQNL